MIIKQKIVNKVLRVKCDKEGLEIASEIINKGGIVVFPTDTVYGLGCNPYKKESVKKIYEIKSRDFSKPLPVLVHSKQIVEKIAVLDEFSKRIVDKFWPGPLTILLKVIDEDLKESLRLNDKIAVRIPDNKCTLDLLEKCQMLIGTSANISGQTSTTNPEDCFKNMENVDVYIDGGIIDSKSESTIIEIENDKIKILREGSLSEELSKL